MLPNCVGCFIGACEAEYWRNYWRNIKLTWLDLGQGAWMVICDRDIVQALMGLTRLGWVPEGQRRPLPGAVLQDQRVANK